MLVLPAGVAAPRRAAVLLVVALLAVGALAAGALAACGADPARSSVGAARVAVAPVRGAPVAGTPADPAPAGPVPPHAPGTAARHRAAEVLHAWDAARARAYATGDARALRRLYVPGSRAGASDVRVLRAYARRDLRVGGMRMQVLALEVLRAGPAVLRLRVTDRLVGAVAVRDAVQGAGERMTLPRDEATSRLVVLRRLDGRWRVAAVRG